MTTTATLPQTMYLAPDLWNYRLDYESGVKAANAILKQIERCGRVCYKSEDKITEDSALKFVKDVLAKEHFSVTETGTLDIIVPKENGIGPNGAILGAFTRVFCHPKDSDLAVVSTSLREILVGVLEQHRIGLWQPRYQKLLDVLNVPAECIGDAVGTLEWLLEDIAAYYREKYYLNPFDYAGKLFDYVLCGQQNTSSSTPTLTHVSPLRVVAMCRTARHVTHELVRHRVFSFLQESQRYVRYDNKLQFIDIDSTHRPFPVEAVDIINKFWAEASKVYDDLRKQDLSPQEARIVLPNQTKTEIMVCGYADYIFNWFLPQRFSPHADPSMQRLARKFALRLARRLLYVWGNSDKPHTQNTWEDSGAFKFNDAPQRRVVVSTVTPLSPDARPESWAGFGRLRSYVVNSTEAWQEALVAALAEVNPNRLRETVFAVSALPSVYKYATDYVNEIYAPNSGDVGIGPKQPLLSEAEVLIKGNIFPFEIVELT